MRLIGNILWFLLVGFPLFVGYLGAGLVLCLTIVGIPFGLQAFKLAVFTAWPFGRVVVDTPRASGCLTVIGNVLWLVFAGIWLALWHVAAGILLCLTIVGIPFGVASMRMAGLALTPFGKVVMTAEEERRMHAPHSVVFGAIAERRRS